MTQILNLPLLTGTFETGTNEDWLDSFAVTNEDDPVSLAGIALRSQARSDAGDVQAWLDLSTSAGTIVVGGAGTNEVSLAVPAATMRFIPPGAYVFDIVGTADGHSRRLLGNATLHIVKGVTR